MLTALLIDFGSTFTKATLVDVQREVVLATAKAPTTVETDIMVGLYDALSGLPQDKIPKDKNLYRACSSAAGGLKIIVIGLIKDLTAEAARLAALGAGARVLSTYAGEITAAEVEAMAVQRPDIILLVGGTDGGNREVVLYNARQLTCFPYDLPIIYAGNKVVAQQVANILQGSFREVVITANVLPELNQLNVGPARKAIRDLYLNRIVKCKGLAQAVEFVGSDLVPTPAAVLNAAELLACGTDIEKGIGELVLVDVGGATTDVYSMAGGEPSKPGVIQKGLLEPFAKRTVEGDLGMRYSAPGIWESLNRKEIANTSHSGTQGVNSLEKYIDHIHKDVHHLPKNDREMVLDTILASAATQLGVKRHAGHWEPYYTPQGTLYVQYGKDLTRVGNLIGTGGVIVHHQSPEIILRSALYNPNEPDSLRPENPKLLLDKNYLLASMGLLRDIYPEVALRLIKKHLQLL